MFKFPFTNFHELNLDWILSVVKEAKEVFDNGQADIDNAVETAEEAKTIAEQAAQAMIGDGAVTTAKLADNAVTGDKILDGSITVTKIANGAVTNSKIVDNAVTAPKIADDAVTTPKIADGAVTPAKLSTVSIEKGGTNGVTTAEARNNLYVSTPNRLVRNATDSANITLFIPNGARLFVVGGAPTSTRCFACFCIASGQGNVQMLEISSGAQVTLSVSANALHIVYDAATIGFVSVFELNNSETVLNQITLT